MKKKLIHLLNLSIYQIYLSIKEYRNLIKRDNVTLKLINGYLENYEVKKLHIGCGTNIYHGWLNTDLNYNEHVAFLDASNTFPFDNGVFNYVYSEHLFEHLKFKQQMNMLKEAYRVLKKGGVMRVATPSIDFLVTLYKESSSEESKCYSQWAVNHSPLLLSVKKELQDKSHYHCYVINNFFKAWGHQMIHDFSSLKALALQCGFSDIRSCKVGESQDFHLKNIERHGTIIPPKMNLLETMVVELVK